MYTRLPPLFCGLQHCVEGRPHGFVPRGLQHGILHNFQVQSHVSYSYFSLPFILPFFLLILICTYTFLAHILYPPSFYLSILFSVRRRFVSFTRWSNETHRSRPPRQSNLTDPSQISQSNLRDDPTSLVPRATPLPRLPIPLNMYIIYNTWLHGLG